MMQLYKGTWASGVTHHVRARGELDARIKLYRERKVLAGGRGSRSDYLKDISPVGIPENFKAVA